MCDDGDEWCLKVILMMICWMCIILMDVVLC